MIGMSPIVDEKRPIDRGRSVSGREAIGEAVRTIGKGSIGEKVYLGLKAHVIRE